MAKPNPEDCEKPIEKKDLGSEPVDLSLIRLLKNMPKISVPRLVRDRLRFSLRRLTY